MQHVGKERTGLVKSVQPPNGSVFAEVVKTVLVLLVLYAVLATFH